MRADIPKMLRLGGVPRAGASSVISTAWRSLCTNTSNTSAESATSSTASSDAPRRRGRNDTPYVQRRYGYRESMRAERIAYLRGEGLGASTSKKEEGSAVKEPKDNTKAKLERAKRADERRRAHEARLALVQEKKAPREAAKAAIFEERQKELKERREAEFTAVLAAAEHWITDDKLDEAVEKVVDSFFIAGDAQMHSDLVYGRGV